MVNTFNIWNRPLYTISAALLLTAFVATTLNVSTDISEKIWDFTRSQEIWQLDELLLAVSISTVVGLIVAFLQISALTKQVAKLKASLPVAKQYRAVNAEQPEYLVQCAICNKYQYEDNLWLRDAEYLARQYDETVISGVCPNCKDH